MEKLYHIPKPKYGWWTLNHIMLNRYSDYYKNYKWTSPYALKLQVHVLVS